MLKCRIPTLENAMKLPKEKQHVKGIQVESWVRVFKPT